MVTVRRHVMFESWCERDHLVVFDFDPQVVDVAAQPFQFESPCVDGARRTHWPDYFRRNADGGGVVVDVKPDHLIDAEDRVKFAASAALCAQAGWSCRRLGELPSIFSANLLPRDHQAAGTIPASGHRWRASARPFLGWAPCTRREVVVGMAYPATAMRTRTSPSRCGSTSISLISQSLPTPRSTAA